MPERDAAYIEKVRTNLATTIWGQAHSKWRTWLDFYECQHPVRAAQSAKKMRLPLAASKVQTFVDTLNTNSPKCHRHPLSESEKDKALADKVERFGDGFFRHGAKVWGLVPPFRSGAINLGVFGYVVKGCLWDDSYWTSKPKEGERRYEEKLEAWKAKRKNVFPFRVVVPHPARVLLPPHERVPDFAVEQFSCYAYQAARDYPTIARLQGFAREDPFKLVQGMVYWETDWVGVVIDGELASQKPNNYGFVPWVHAYAGRGIEHMTASFGASGTVSGSFGPAPEDMAKGLLARNEDVITGVDEMVTAARHMALVDVYRTTITSSDATKVAVALSELGAVIGPFPTDAIKWAEPLQVQPWVFEALRLLMSSLDTGMLADVVQGGRTPGVDTATQHAIQLAQARLGFVMPVDQLNYLAAQVLGMAMRMIEVNEEKITIDGITCGPDDLQGNYDIEVDFMGKDEASDMRQLAASGNEVEKGRRSLEKHLEQTGEEDVTTELRRIFVEKAANSEQAMALVLQAADAAIRQKYGLPPPMLPAPAGNGGAAPAGPGPGRPQSFIAQPGGPEEQAAIMEGMTRVPGDGMERAMPQ